MSEELSETQLRILGFIKEHRDRTHESACYLDDFFEDMLPKDLLEGEHRFAKEIRGLEEGGYVKIVLSGLDQRGERMRFGCYEITPKGLKAIE